MIRVRYTRVSRGMNARGRAGSPAIADEGRLGSRADSPSSGVADRLLRRQSLAFLLNRRRLGQSELDQRRPLHEWRLLDGSLST